ncbi:MAG: general secretion pathway protein GspK [Synergistaceae bacterium]|nr:general secretion pathway protein GspK [Synergistaceae bacterium]
MTVLLISALFLSAAVSYAWFARQEMRRASAEEFASVSRGLAVIACREVSGWIASDGGDSDSRHERLYSGEPLGMDYGEFLVSVTITPLDDKIPINGLFLPDGVTMKNEYAYPWNQILGALGVKNASVILDFMDADHDARSGSREDEIFANRPVSDLSELLWLPEMTRGTLYSGVSSDVAMDGFFTVYGGSGININMAPAPVIAALDPGIGSDVAEAVAVFRLNNEIKNAEDLGSVAGFSSTAITRLKNVLNYKSDFFLVRLTIEHRTVARNFEAIVKRGGNGCEIINWRE